MRLRKFLSFILIIAMVLSFLSSTSAADTQVIIKTDWTITENEDIQNQTIIVKGLLTVKSGGKLNLNNSTLLMEGSEGIVAEQGSGLSVIASKIKSNSPGTIYYPITINSDNATIKDSEITGLGSGKDKYDSSFIISSQNATIQNCKIEGSIRLENSKNSKIINNKLSVDRKSPAPYNGIKLANSKQVNISNNTLYGFGCGIYCSYSWDNIIDSNVWYAQREELINKNVKKWWALDITAGYIGIAGVWLNEMSNNNKVTNNQFYGSACTGFRITQSTNNVFEKNVTKGTRVGGVVNFASNNVLNKNEFYDIWEYEAIEVYRAHDNYIINNRVETSTLGIGLISSKDNTVSGNHIENSGKGIFIYNAVNNTVNSNNVSNNLLSITVDNSSGNTISSNNFTGNKEEAFGGSGNKWDSNYWNGITSAKDAKLDTKSAAKINEIKSIAPPVITPAQYAEQVQKLIIIDKTEVWENKTVELDGFLIISETGSLNLNNVNLIFKPGPYTVYESAIMANGGTLKINNSKITGPEYDRILNITARNCKSFELKDSTLSFLGNWEGGPGLTTENVENVVIENNKFTGCYAAGRIDKVKKLVYKNNTIDNCYMGMSIVGFSGSIQVNDNNISRAAYHGLKIFALDGKVPAPSTVAGNTVSDSWGDGIYDTGIDKMGVVVKDNKFVNLKGPGRISVTGLDIDTRAVRPLCAVNNSGIMKTHVIFTGLYNYNVNHSIMLSVTLNQSGKLKDTKTMNLTPGEQGYVSLTAPNTNGAIFEIKMDGKRIDESITEKKTPGSDTDLKNGKPIILKVNGKNIKFADPLVEKGGDYLAAAETLAKALNASYKFDSKAKTITLERGKSIISLKIDEKYMTKGKSKIQLKVAADYKKTPRVPVKAVAEALGFKYSFDVKTNILYISEKQF